MRISRAKVKDFIVSNKKIIGAKNIKQDGTLRSWYFRIDVDRTNGFYYALHNILLCKSLHTHDLTSYTTTSH